MHKEKVGAIGKGDITSKASTMLLKVVVAANWRLGLVAYLGWLNI
jgi:hypothetical protein